MKFEKRLNGNNPEKLTRRKFLKAALGVILVSSLAFIFWRMKRKDKETYTEKEFSVEQFLKQLNQDLSEIENNPKLELSQEKIEELEKIKEKFETLTFPIKAYFFDNPSLALDTLWEKKIDRIREEDLILKLREIKLNLLREYGSNPKGYIEELDKFEEYLKCCVIESLSVLDINGLLESNRYKFESEIRNLILEILKDEKFVDFLSSILLSLILVEICYAKEETKDNRMVLTYLLRKHGLRFLSFIPSIYDERLSLGPFQLTDLVVGKEKGKFYPINFINNFVFEFDKEKYNLPEYKLPDSLEKFEIRDHFRAEIYLLLFYFLELFKKVELDHIKKSHQKNKIWFYYQICYYLAGCHHLPSISQKLFIEFLNEEKNIEYQKSFIEFIKSKSANEGLIKYLERFEKNLKGAE